MIETVVLLQPIGAECPDDIGLLADDGCFGELRPEFQGRKAC